MTKLLYFGRLSDITGISEETLELPSEIDSAGQLRIWLDRRFETNGALLEPTIRIAINSEITFDTASLAGAQEIAFMPPVGGG